jgi:RecA-family ATPase
MTKPILKGSDYLALPRAPETWLIEPLLPAGGAAMVYGDPKIGKSYAALQMALDLQAGTDWLGFHIPRPARPVYIQLDTPRSLWADRLDSLQAQGVMGIDLLPQADLGTLNTWPFDILSNEHEELLRLALKPFNADLVIIDTLRECHSGDENDSTVMRDVIARLIGACQPAALLLIHHSKKPVPDQQIDLMNDMRGGYVAGKMDAIIKFTNRGVHYTGRSIEQGIIPAERAETGMWTALGGDMDHWLPSVLADPLLDTNEKRAMALSELTSRPLGQCRGVVRRGVRSGQGR